MPDHERDGRYAIVLVALTYVIIGVGTAALAKSAPALPGRNAWRAAAWVVSLAIFATQIAFERLRLGNAPRRAAMHVAASVALGTVVLAAVGPVRSHWGEANLWGTAALSVVLWPALTAIPSFFIAIVAGTVVGPRRFPAA